MGGAVEKVMKQKNSTPEDSINWQISEQQPRTSMRCNNVKLLKIRSVIDN